MTFILDVLEANFGRHDTDATFIRGAKAATSLLQWPHKYGNDAASLAYLVFGISELDEADGPDEHALLRYALTNSGKHTQIGWDTYEPIIAGRGLKVTQPQVTHASDGKAHLSPTRHIVHGQVYPANMRAVSWWGHLPRVAVINHHAPRNTPQLAAEIKACREAHARVQQHYADKGVSFVTMGDWNDPDYPTQVPGTKTAVHAGLDYIRYYNAPGGARLSVLATDSAVIGIDPHRAHLARIKVARPRKGSKP